MISQSDLEIVCRQCDVSEEMLMFWVEEQLIPVPNEWDDELLETVRRIRRLTVLGVSVPGVDMILHMRRQLIEQQERIQRVQQEIEQLRVAHEQEIARLMRTLSIEF